MFLTKVLAKLADQTDGPCSAADWQLAVQLLLNEYSTQPEFHDCSRQALYQRIVALMLDPQVLPDCYRALAIRLHDNSPELISRTHLPDDVGLDLAALNQQAERIDNNPTRLPSDPGYQAFNLGSLCKLDIDPGRFRLADGRPQPQLRVLISSHDDAADALAKQLPAVQGAIDNCLRLFDLLRHSAEQYTMFDHSPIPMSITDTLGVIRRVNNAFCAECGYDGEQLLGRSHAMLSSGHSDDDLYRLLWRTIKSGRVWHGELSNRHRNGSIYWDATTIIPLKNAADEVYGYWAIKRSTTREHMLTEQAEYAASHDDLTGLLNADVLKHQLNERLEQAQQGLLMLIDIGSLARVNTTLGFEVGDQMLQQAAQGLLEAIPGPDQVYRYSGDAFAVVIGTQLDEPGALIRNYVDRIKQCCGPTVQLGASTIPYDFRIGLARFPQDAHDLTTLLSRASLAMNTARKQRNTGWQLYDETEEQKLHRKLQLESEIVHALELDQFELWYQPKIDPKSGRVAGAEALLRWHHPQLGMISPAEFIPVAEKTRTIIKIGRWIIQQAAPQLAAWQRQFGQFRLSFNISPAQLFDSRLVDTVQQVIKRHQLPPSSLIVELTETMLVDQPERAKLVLGQLADLGVKVSIDDFGTGYSSMNYLKDFPVHELKIDRSMVTDVASDPAGATIVNAIISLTKNLSLDVVAEGVEQLSESEYLSAKNCDLLQGFLYSKPLPLSDFNHYLIEQQRGQNQAGDLPIPGVLFVDDETSILKTLKRLFRQQPYPCYFTDSVEEAYLLLARYPIAVVVSDQRMPGMCGTEFLARVRKLHPETVRIMLTGFADIDSMIDSINTGVVFRFHTKPWQDELLTQSIDSARQLYLLESQNNQIKSRLQRFTNDFMLPERQAIEGNPSLAQLSRSYNEVVNLYFASSFNPVYLRQQLEQIHQQLERLQQQCANDPDSAALIKQALEQLNWITTTSQSASTERPDDSRIIQALSSLKILLEHQQSQTDAN